VRPSTLRWIASGSLIALIFLCVLWESLLAPLRPGGTLLTLKALPLMACLFGILRGRVYTYQWSSMLVLLYFTEGVVRCWSESGMSRSLAVAEIALSVTFFLSAICFARTRTRNP
jgi:uncharacterized membrane protein